APHLVARHRLAGRPAAPRAARRVPEDIARFLVEPAADAVVVWGLSPLSPAPGCHDNPPPTARHLHTPRPRLTRPPPPAPPDTPPPTGPQLHTPRPPPPAHPPPLPLARARDRHQLAQGCERGSGRPADGGRGCRPVRRPHRREPDDERQLHRRPVHHRPA